MDYLDRYKSFKINEIKVAFGCEKTVKPISPKNIVKKIEMKNNLNFVSIIYNLCKFFFR